MAGRNHLLRTQGSVENLLSKTRRFIGNGISEDDLSLLFIQNRLQGLYDIYKEAYDSETRAYEVLGINNLQELQAKFDEVSDNPVIRAMNNESGRFDELVAAATEGRMIDYQKKESKFDPIQHTVDTFTFFLNNNQTNRDELGEALLSNQNIVGPIVKYFNEVTSQMRKKDKTVVRISTNAGIGRGLTAILGTVYYDPDQSNKKRLAFTVELNSNELRGDWAKRLTNQLNENIGFEYLYSSKKTPLGIIKQFLKTLAIGDNIEQYVFDELDKNFKNYDLNKNDQVIKGFLGEVRATAILKYLLNNTTVIPTGTLKTVENSTEIPIDIVFKAACKLVNIQVKNYRDIKGKITLGHRSTKQSMEIGNFIDGRLQLKGTDEGNLLKQLFVSYYYNISVDESFNTTRAEINNQATQQAIEYFNNYIDNIIKVSDTFSVKNNRDNLFLERAQYVNTFFIFNRKIIPASEIIYQIYLQVKSQQQNMLTTKFIINPDLTADNGLIDGARQFPSKALGQFNNILKQVKIHYEIHLDTSKLMEAANAAINSAHRFTF